MWALKRIGNGKFVSLPGSKSAYTTALQYAQLFHTREDALANSCVESEYPVEIDLSNNFRK